MNRSVCESNLPGVKCVWSGGQCTERDSSYIESCDPSQGNKTFQVSGHQISLLNYCSAMNILVCMHFVKNKCNWCILKSYI